MKENTPLVSIVIASYNAVDFIEDTLNSCINQIYGNIEIIITDDCSSDDTVKVCENLLGILKEKYPNTEVLLLKNNKNVGIVKNLNRAINFCNGEWIKFIGSDDILMPDAISNYMDFICHNQKKNNLGAVFGKFRTFSDSAVIDEKIFPLKYTRTVIGMKSGWLKKKVINLHFNNVAPSAFIRASVLRSLGNFDENYVFLEDLPLWMKMVTLNIDIDFLDKIAVLYRIHNNQVTHSTTSGIKKILLDDLLRLNQLRKENGFYFAYLHHKYQFWLREKYVIPPRFLRFLDPIEFFICGFDKVIPTR
ncbi:glycosyltransferase [Pectobacterium brasiliense]|uniref:glycosyltransferase n=1 Tax=Pectobacterium brasiliense TaxID=180957 RepID=UPI0019699C09|nr:glycosyltransferase [Pectobacterium brasiliense]MBN3263471.1 glycosyltransferase [Pectobacterium brasiliense]